MNELRFGILGCGNISKTHAVAVTNARGALLSAVCDIVESKAGDLGAKFGVPFFSDCEAFFKEVDVVLVCLPSGMHAEYAVRAANQGKHVLTEKPLDITFANGIRMVEQCESAGVTLGCISQHRFARDVQALKAAAESGELGKLIEGDAYIKWYRSQGYYDSAGWRGTYEMDGGGCLMNQGVHYIDMIQWIMGGVASVQARARTAMHSIEVEDQAMAIVEYNNGALGVIQGSTATYPGLSERLEVHGTMGSVVVEGDRAKIWTVKPTDQHEAFGPMVSLGQPKELTDDPTLKDWDELHRLQIENFAQSILNSQAPFITGRQALEPLKVILAIYESVRRGGSKVTLDEIASGRNGA